MIFERSEFRPKKIAIYAVLVSNIKEEEGKTYCLSEEAVTLSWATELDGSESMGILRGDYEGPKSWYID